MNTSIIDTVVKNTTSPNDCFYYKFRKPLDLNPSAFGAKIAFFDKHDELLYYNSNMFAHELVDPAISAEIRAIAKGVLDTRKPNNKEPEEATMLLANWSMQGNMCYLLEYCKANYSYYNVFLNLEHRYQVRLLHGISRQSEYVSIPASTITKLDLHRKKFDEAEVIGMLKKLGLYKEEPLVRYPLKKNYLVDFFFGKRWYK